MPLTLTIEGLSKFESVADAAFAGQQLIKSGIRQEAALFSKDLESHSKREYLSGRPGLRVQTGRLRSSIRGMMKENKDGLEITLGTDVPYAKYHEQPDGEPTPRFIPRRAFLDPTMRDLYPGFEKRVEGILAKFATGELLRGK